MGVQWLRVPANLLVVVVVSTVRRLECEDCGCPVDDQDENGLWWCDKCDDLVLAHKVLVTVEEAS